MTSPDPVTLYIALGSNIDPEANLRRCVDLLRSKITVKALSSVYRTPPQGDPNQADFLNMVVQGQSNVTPGTLKTDVLDWIERELKRVRDPLNKNAPRTIDLDLLLWGDAVLEYGSKPWKVPDADILRYAHVAVPLAELAPEQIHPTEKVTFRAIAERFENVPFEIIPLFRS